jgi:alpha-beta hydrolase superfamily lysophospholipase
MANGIQVKSSDHSGAMNEDMTRTTALVCLLRLTLLGGLLALVLAASGCTANFARQHPAFETSRDTIDAFIMPDGTRLPYRTWQPDDKLSGVILALHGMNDSRDAWEYPGPEFAAHGIAVIAPDQRGFGATQDRGYWPGTQALVGDAREMAMLLRQRYPHTKVILMGESMGAAVLMCLAAADHPPPVDGYVLVAPAVWGRAEMSPLLRSVLWVAAGLVPGLHLTGTIAGRVASDNQKALHRLASDPLTIHATRVDAIKGLVDLMGAALNAAPHFNGPALFLYGGKDQMIPSRATTAAWEALPSSVVRAYYPSGYHLLLRDLDRMTPTDDIMAWMQSLADPLPSGADRAAAVWLSQQQGDEHRVH